jgi:hypothetical protein
MVMTGARELYWGSPEDAEAVQKHYPRSQLHIFKDSAGMPFVESNKEFITLMEKFLH